MPGRKAIITRLRRIEGQVRGLGRMLAQEKPCDELLTQLMAARGALDQVGLKVIERYIRLCLPDNATPEAMQAARSRLRGVLRPLGRVLEQDEEEKPSVGLQRLESQIGQLIRMVEQEEPCEQILTHLMATRGTLDHAGLGVIASHLDDCLHNHVSTEEIQQARRDLRRALELFLRMH
jgi:DNA-binding FrmR family transcriptional regulator